MTHTNRIFGKIALFSLMLVGLVGISAGSAYASDHKAKPAPATTMKKAAAPATTKKAKTEKKKEITLEEARAKALKRVNGKVESEALKTEHGKSVYEFQIRDSKGRVKNIWVEQANGKIIRGGRKWY